MECPRGCGKQYSALSQQPLGHSRNILRKYMLQKTSCLLGFVNLFTSESYPLSFTSQYLKQINEFIFHIFALILKDYFLASEIKHSSEIPPSMVFGQKKKRFQRLPDLLFWLEFCKTTSAVEHNALTTLNQSSCWASKRRRCCDWSA